MYIYILVYVYTPIYIHICILYIYIYTRTYHTSAGQNHLLLAMDMAKVGRPLIRLEHPKSTPYYFSFPLILLVTHIQLCQITIYIHNHTHMRMRLLYEVVCICTSSTAQGGGGSFKNRKPIGEIGCCESGMAERIHWWTERCLRSPLLSTHLPTYLLCIYLSIYRSIYLSLSLCFI